MTKKNQYILQFSLLIGAIFLTTLLIIQRVETAYASPSQITIQNTTLATTTMVYLSPGALATSTYQFDSQVFSQGKMPSFQQIDSANMFLAFNASTTNSTLAYQIQGSNNGIDWYGQSSVDAIISSNIASTTSNGTQLASSTQVTLWAPGLTGTSTIEVPITVMAAPHERIQFYLPLGSAPGAVYAEFDFKNLPGNP